MGTQTDGAQCAAPKFSINATLKSFSSGLLHLVVKIQTSAYGAQRIVFNKHKKTPLPMEGVFR